MKIKSSLLFLILVFATPSWTWAGQYLDQCQQSSTQAKQQADQAAQSANANDAGRSGADGATAAARGNTVNPNAGTSAANAQAQSQNLANALSQAQAAKSKCDNDCQQAQSQAQAASSQPPPQGPQAAADAAAIPGVQQSSCDALIQQDISQLQQGKSAADQAANQANNTKQNSGGMPSPPSPPSSSPTPSPAPSPAAAQTALDCTQTANNIYTACDEANVQACTSNLGATGCNTFTARYCDYNSAAANTPATPVAGTTTMVNGTQETANQTGAGVGSAFCQTAISYQFCQDSSRSSCLTCQNFRNSQSSTCQNSPTACLASNSSNDVAAAACPVAEPTFTTNPINTSTGKASTSYQVASVAVRTSSPVIARANTKSSSLKASSDLGVQSVSEKVTPKKQLELSVSAVKTAALSPSTTPSLEVYEENGKNLFNLSSGVYQNLCLTGRLNCPSSR